MDFGPALSSLRARLDGVVLSRSLTIDATRTKWHRGVVASVVRLTSRICGGCETESGNQGEFGDTHSE